LASRRRRRKTIGKVVSDVERRVRVVEKRPGAKRIKRNVVTAEKIQYRAIVAKNVATDTITPTEVSFGTTVVTTTEPTENLKEGTTWVDPDTGTTQVYDSGNEVFVELSASDLIARQTADGKNTIYAQTAAPSGGTYKINDIWFDTDDGNKLYTWSGSAWVSVQDTAIAAAQSTADGKNRVYRQTAEPTGGTYAEGDLWFDTDDNNKIYRRTSNAWTAVQLGGAALANINANAITAGTIDASVITVSNITAANISTGTLSADRIAANSLSVDKLTAGTLRAGTVYAGDIAASQITAGTITAAISITSPTITGATITGGTIRTAASGTRIELTTATSNRIDFWGSGTAQGAVSVNDYRIFVYAPGSSFGAGAVLSLYGDQAGSTPNGIFMTGGDSLALAFAMSSSTISLASGSTYKLRITSAGIVVDGAATATGYYLRNARITTSTITSGAASETTDGNIVLVREA
jgi:hypothetical protein